MRAHWNDRGSNRRRGRQRGGLRGFPASAPEAPTEALPEPGPGLFSEPDTGTAGHHPERLAQSRFEAERPRFFLWSPVALGAGIATYFALPFEPPPWLPLVAVAIALLVRMMTPRGTLSSALVAGLVLTTAGLGLAKLRVESVRAPVLEKPLRSAQIEGEVLRVEPRSPRGARVTVRVTRLAGLDAAKRPAVIRVTTLSKKIPAMRIGDGVAFSARLSPPAIPAIPGGFDFARSAWFDRIGGVGYTYSKLSVTPRAPPRDMLESLARDVATIRQSVTARIHAALPGDTGGIAAALIAGERGGISQETNEAYRSAGLFHILSISGLHMVIMAGAVFYTVRLLLAAIPGLALRFPIKKWAAVAGMLGALGYLSISGGAFATVRSALMILVVFGAVLLDRPAIALRNVALSALIILIVYPESLFDAGFQMSFAAVTGLVATYEEVRRRSRRSREPHPIMRVLMFFGGIVFTTLIASAAVAPFAAYHFHQSQQYAVLANLVAIPISNFWVMPAALAALVLMPLGLEGAALQVMGLGIDATTWCARTVADLPGAVGHIPAIPWFAFVLIVAGGLWLTLWQTRLRLAGAVLALAGLALAPNMRRPDVLVAENGNLVAVRTDSGSLSALPARGGKYQLSRWLESDGDARSARDAQTGGGFTCDGIGCIARVNGAIVAVARMPAAISDDCRMAKIAVLNVPRPNGCDGADTVIDLFDVWRAGTHALYIERDAHGENSIEVDTVAAHRGIRPWAPLNDRRAPKKVELPVPRITPTVEAGQGEEVATPDRQPLRNALTPRDLNSDDGDQPDEPLNADATDE